MLQQWEVRRAEKSLPVNAKRPLRLYHMLRRYGPDAVTIRDTLRQYTERNAADLFPENPGDPVRIGEDQRAGRWRGTAKTECGLHR